MTKTAFLNVENNILTSIQDLLTSILARDDIEAILAPCLQNDKKHIMPEFITRPDRLQAVNPLAPIFPMNTARQVSRLTHKPMGKKIAVVLRPCEIRAVVELVKLRQVCLDDLVIIGIDCMGAYTSKDLAQLSVPDIQDWTLRFCQGMLEGKDAFPEAPPLSAACRACEQPVPENADLAIGLWGMDIQKQLMLQAKTKKGLPLFDALALKESDEPAQRKKVIAETVARKIEYRDRMFADTHEATNSIEKLSGYLAGCINCYNCRVACPVCYCRECVFNTDVFDHDPYQYLQWAKRKGSVKLPADTVFYHLTRLAHMSLACVGCGQCSNACPNDIPVMALFRTVADQTQKAFEYQAGKNIDQAPPLSVFKEKEYADVVGIH